MPVLVIVAGLDFIVLEPSRLLVLAGVLGPAASDEARTGFGRACAGSM